jgi:excisionase family DNA binding protein
MSLSAHDVMDAQAVSELLHAPKSTIQHWARTGVLPSVRLGSRRVFIRSKIEAILLAEDSTDTDESGAA